MRKASLTVAVCATLLWAGTALGWVSTCSSCTAQLGTCTGNLNTCKAQLNTCTSNDTTCTANLATCTTSLASTQGELATCLAAASIKPRLLDNGDGTVRDTKTGLMWEKKTTDGSVHDVTNTFTWSTEGSSDFDGTAKTAFLDKLNDVAGGGANCFSGYCDWRLPDEWELEPILDLTQGNCGGGTGACVVPALSPTRSSLYWSSTSEGGMVAWFVDFGAGAVSYDVKNYPYYVRAVRRGL